MDMQMIKDNLKELELRKDTFCVNMNLHLI